ncbi:hypothetical protein RYX36_012526, partial [Vicia faba]
ASIFASISKNPLSLKYPWSIFHIYQGYRPRSLSVLNSQTTVAIIFFLQLVPSLGLDLFYSPLLTNSTHFIFSSPLVSHPSPFYDPSVRYLLPSPSSKLHRY